MYCTVIQRTNLYPSVPLPLARVRRSFSLKAKISENLTIFFSKKNVFFFSLFFAFSETLQESENNESETKIISEKLKSLKVIFKYLVIFITDFCRCRFVHRDRYLEQHQTEKIYTEVKDIEDMIGYESQKCMHPVHGAAFWGVIRALQSDR